MAKIASETRIYRETKKFLNEVIYVIKDFPKEQRYVVGDRIGRTAINSLHIIAKVYMERNLRVRIAEMTELQSNLELLNTLIEIAGEHQWIKGRSKLANLLLLMDSIGRQSTAWKGSLVAAFERAESERSQS
jgi:hypothetical protein